MSYRTQHHYKITLELTVDGERLPAENDIIYCSFLRTPIARIASKCIVRANIPQDTANRYIKALSNHDFERNLEVLLTITMHDEQESDISEKEGNPIYKRLFKCIALEPILVSKNVGNDIPCHMILVNKMLHTMATQNTYNVILNGTSSIDALNKFEKWVTSTYGDFVNFQKVGVDKDQSDFVYEQILTNQSNDLNIPTQIINSFKTNDICTTYFWDDFVISDSNIARKDVCAWHINFNNTDALDKVDVTKQGDMSKLVSYIKDIPCTDIFNEIHFGSEQRVYNLPSHVTGKVPNNDPYIDTQRGGKVEKINITKGREKTSVLNTEAPSSIPYETTVKSISIFAPDDEEHADKRITKTKDMFDKIERFVEFNIGPCFPDFPQFGQKYNLNYYIYDEAINEFKFTPLNICNTFVRKSNKEPWLIHSVKSLMIQYKPKIG